MRASVPAFSMATVVWLLVVGLASFAASVLFAVFGEDIVTARSAGTDTWSLSAVGHRAFAETLRRLDVPVIASRYRPAETAGAGGLLVIAEPAAAAGEPGRAIDIAGATVALLVLPKWSGSADPDRPNWIEAVRPLPLADVRAVARELVADAEVVRRGGPAGWAANRFGIAPTLDRPQLLVSGRLRPIIRAETGGILLGEVERRGVRVWVLADPDLIANHGLQRGANAALAVAIVEALRPAGGAVVFDETVHGFARTPSLWRELFGFPLVLVTLQVLVASAALAWAAAGRFGAPLPVPPSLEAGRGALLASTAGLLALGGHLRPLVGRYLDVAARDVARRVHAPRHLDEAGVAAWLEHVGSLRGIDVGYARLSADTAALVAARRADPGALLDLARRIHRWQRAMTDRRG